MAEGKISYPLTHTITHLRREEEIILESQWKILSPEDEQKTVVFLQQEYQQECLTYPHTPPEFNETTALWAAKTVFTASRLLLYREHPGDQLPSLLPPYDGILNAGVILSADLTLRFLPDMLQLAFADPEDELIAVCETLLCRFHYSGIGYLSATELDMAPFTGNACLEQLYADRIIRRKAAWLGQHPQWADRVKGSVGNYVGYLFPEL